MGEKRRRRAAGDGKQHHRMAERRGFLRRPDGQGACWPRGEWNTIDSEYHRNLTHVRLALIKVPEGYVGLMRCTHCDGRSEELLDCRVDAYPHSPCWLDRLNAFGTGFENAHRQCPITKREYALPPALAQALSTRLAEAERAVRLGRRSDSQITLVCDERVLHIEGVSALPPGSINEGRDRLLGIAELQFGIRTLIERESLSPTGLILVTEAWGVPWPGPQSEYVAPGAATNRQEMLIVTVVTPTFARCGLADITRRSGCPEEGPGMIGELTWCQLGPSALVDGLLAQSGESLHIVQAAIAATASDAGIATLLH